VQQDLSTVCMSGFKQYQPLGLASYWKNSRPVVKGVLHWVNNISQEKEDTRKTTIKVEFIEGGTIGPVPNG
jgi:hypothetical protein